MNYFKISFADIEKYVIFVTLFKIFAKNPEESFQRAVVFWNHAEKSILAF